MGSKPYLAINKVSDRMTGMPEQITPAPDQVEIEGAVENNKKETGEKNKEVMEDATSQASKTDITDKDEDEDKAEKNTTNEEENDKNKEKDKDKGDDDEKTKKGNKDDKVEKKRMKIFKTYICNICKNEIMKKTQASISCKACMEWCHIKKCSGLKNTREAQIMNSTYRCQICVKNGREVPKDRWEAPMPPKRGRPRGSTTSKLLHFSNHQKSDSKKENRLIER